MRLSRPSRSPTQEVFGHGHWRFPLHRFDLRAPDSGTRSGGVAMKARIGSPPPRRRFLTAASAALVAPLVLRAGACQAEPPPEVRKIRLIHFPAVCLAFGYLAKDFLLAEGFDEVEYVELRVNNQAPPLATGQADLWVEAAPSLVTALATDNRIVALGGVHAGCYELLGHDRVRAVRDIKNRSVAISEYGSTEHIFVSSIAAYVGIDPRREIEWVVGRTTEGAQEAFASGKADAFLGFAPQPQHLSARKVGHVILNTTEDRPWSQYFCCMLTGNRAFVRRNPIATRRAMRAMLMAADLCAADPARAARHMVDQGYERSYDTALQVISGLPYRRWRDSNPEDTIRFHALRLHEVGIIRITPQKLIAQGTDWRLFQQLRREIKA